MTILDSRGRQIVRLIGFGNRVDTREPANDESWLGSSSATGQSTLTSSSLWWHDREPNIASCTPCRPKAEPAK